MIKIEIICLENQTKILTKEFAIYIEGKFELKKDDAEAPLIILKSE